MAVRRSFAVAALALAALGGGAGLVLADGDGDGDGVSGSGEASGSSPVRWERQLEAVFRPPIEGLPAVLSGLEEWRRGTRPADQMAAQLDGAEAAFAGIPGQVAALPRLGRARDHYLASARLYRESLRLYRAAVDLPPGPVREQADLQARRVQILADRTFDRGRAAVDPQEFDPMEGMELRYPEEVPDWESEGLAPGPPLAGPPPVAGGDQRLRQAARPEQPARAWLEAVRNAGVPSSGRLARAIDAGAAETLGELAHRLTQTARELWLLPDPEGDRERSAAAGLGLLVRGEAARAAQVATLVVGPDDVAVRIAQSARRLAFVGDDLWSRAVGDHSPVGP